MRSISRVAIPLLSGLLLLPHCTMVDAVRAQKQVPSSPAVAAGSMRPARTTSSPDDRPAETRFKNIRVLTGLPSSQLFPVMQLFSNSLGVTCAHCHTENFEEESRREKQIARRMIEMTRAINQAQFQGEPTVTCNSCHNGHQYPQAVPQLAQAGWRSLLTKPSAAPLPELDDVLARYRQAAGKDTEPLPAHASGTLSLAGGLDEKATGRFSMTVAKDGAVTIETDVDYPGAVERALRRYMSGRLALEAMYDEMTVIRTESIDGSDAVVVMAQSGDSVPERLAFDRASGLLVRVQFGTPTALGYVPEEISLGDYVPVHGTPTPRAIRWERGDFQVALHLDDIVPAAAKTD